MIGRCVPRGSGLTSGLLLQVVLLLGCMKTVVTLVQTIDGDVTWSQEIIKVDHEVQILHSGHLHIQGGVTVQFDMFAGLVVYGKLDIHGTKKNPVLLLPVSPQTNWAGIRVETTRAINIEHTHIERAYVGIDAVMANLHLNHVSIRNSRQEGIKVRHSLQQLSINNSQIVANSEGGVHIEIQETSPGAFIKITNTTIKGSRRGLLIQDKDDNSLLNDVDDRLDIRLQGVLVTSNTGYGIRVMLGRYLFPQFTLEDSLVTLNGIGVALLTRSGTFNIKCSVFSFNTLENLSLERLVLSHRRWSMQEHHKVTIQGSTFHHQGQQVIIRGPGSSSNGVNSFLHIVNNDFGDGNAAEIIDNGDPTVQISDPRIFGNILIKRNRFTTVSQSIRCDSARGSRTITISNNIFRGCIQAIRVNLGSDGMVALTVKQNKFTYNLGTQSEAILAVYSNSPSNCIVIEENDFSRNKGTIAQLDVGYHAHNMSSLSIIYNSFVNPSSKMDVHIINTFICDQAATDPQSTNPVLLPEVCQAIWPLTSDTRAMDISHNWWGSMDAQYLSNKIPGCIMQAQPILVAKETYDFTWTPMECAEGDVIRIGRQNDINGNGIWSQKYEKEINVKASSANRDLPTKVLVTVLLIVLGVTLD